MPYLRAIGFIILGLALSRLPGSAQTPKFVQQNYTTPSSAQSTIAVAYPAVQRVGNANIVVVGWNDIFASIASVGDSAGNTYQVAVPDLQANGLSQAIYYARDIRAGANTVSVTFNQPAAFVDLRVVEYSGLSVNNDVLEAGTSATGDSTNADSGPVSISTTNDLVFAAGMTATSFTAASDGFTLRVITSLDGDIVEDQVASGSGLYHGVAALDSGAWLMQVAAFKPATPAGARLSIALAGTTLLISWPAAQSGFKLQANTQLGTANWFNVTNTVGIVGNQNQVTVPLSGPQTYFRLKSP